MELSFAYINDDEKKMEKAFRFRYEIFCEEKNFFDGESLYGPMETDLFDEYSLHFGAFDQFGDIKGYARLVCHSENGYPMQRLCPYEITGAKDFIGESSAEVSRLAITKDFRSFYQKSSMGNTGAANNKNDTDLYIAPQIQFGLFRMICAACLQLDITHVFAVMEPFLYKRLLRFSLKFKAIGDEFENHGKVFPFLGRISDFEKSLFSGNLSLFPFQDQNSEDFHSDVPFLIASYGKICA